MLIGGVIDDEINNHANTTLLCLMRKIDEVSGRAVFRIDSVEVAYVIPGVQIRRWIEGLKPNARYAEAGQYLSSPYDKVLEKYVKGLQDGANEKLSKLERAHAWFTAAWLARYDGMELMGTEFAPDGFAESGDFEIPDLAKERRSGVYETIAYDKTGQASYDKNGNPRMKKVPAVIKASAQ